MNNNYGKLTTKHCPCQYVTWRVPNFFSLPKEKNYFLDSPKFQFADDTWCLRLFPNGYEFYKDWEVSIDIWLLRLVSSVPEPKFSCKVGFIKNNGKEYEIDGIYGEKYVVFKGQKLFAFRFFEDKATVKEYSHLYVPGGALTVFCQLLLSESANIDMLQPETLVPASKTEFKKDASTGTEPPFCEKEKSNELQSGGKLKLDYTKLLSSGAESDVLLVVSGQEFQAHRCILRARSPVFDAMFKHEMEEKDTKKVTIDDLDPDAFRDFLEYIYVGHVEVFSDKNAFALYTAADKYDVQELKSESLEFIQKTLSVESFCDVMTLALCHQENDLIDQAVDFYRKNVSQIIRTVKWQIFMKNNSTAANELFIKGLDPSTQ